jgi:hypothetical protein
MKLLLLLTFLFLSINISYSQTGELIDKKNRIRYRYKKYQKFDFENLSIEGESGSPGDLSIIPRYQTKFKNKLPYRRNFNDKIRLGIERIR